MGRGPRRPRLRFRDEPGGASTRAFVRREDTEPHNARDERGHPIRTLENRREWQAEADRLADWFLALHPATQRKMTVFVVRCPAKGCLLGRVFRRGDPRAAVRYVWLGVTWTGRGTAGILNWAWDGGRGSKDFMLAKRGLHPRYWECRVRASTGNDGGVGFSPASPAGGLASPLRGAHPTWVRASDAHPARHALEGVDVICRSELLLCRHNNRPPARATRDLPGSLASERPSTTGRAPAVAAWR